jgi:hypothetical protein
MLNKIGKAKARARRLAVKPKSPEPSKPQVAKRKTKPGTRLRIFLSYSHEDHSELAERLCRDLKRRPGYEVRFDKLDLRPGTDWEHALEEGLDWVAGTAQARLRALMG